MEVGVRLQDVGDTLGGVKLSNLNNISTVGPPELIHLLLDAHAPELAHVEPSPRCRASCSVHRTNRWQHRGFLLRGTLLVHVIATSMTPDLWER